jgi:uncharacterized protein (DUF488 family)
MLRRPGIPVARGARDTIMRYTIYLIGYGNQVPDDFFDRLEVAGERCMVLDIRAKRKSWCWSYTGPQVEYVVKERGHNYIWLYELGAVGRNGGNDDVKLFNEPSGMMVLERQVRESRQPVVLLCAELRSSECHRSVVARRLASRLERVGDQLEVRML